jgi:hypothetical protein
MSRAPKLQKILVRELSSDDSYTLGNEKNLLLAYEKFNRSQKEAIDVLFVYLCGWSFVSILEMAKNENGEVLSERT